jgi:hypothetical protein
VAARPLLAGVVQQPLSDVLPHRLGSGQPDRVGLPDLDGAATAAAGDPQQVALNAGQALRPDRGADRPPAGIGRRSSRTACPYSAGISSPGLGVCTDGAFLPTTAAFASLSICFGLGMRQLAGRSVTG